MYGTSIELDVHARSISAAAFNLYTDEMAQKEFGVEAGSIEKWARGFKRPKCVYESGPQAGTWRVSSRLKGSTT